jgi:hypothetical protein
LKSKQTLTDQLAGHCFLGLVMGWLNMTA